MTSTILRVCGLDGLPTKSKQQFKKSGWKSLCLGGGRGNKLGYVLGYVLGYMLG